MPAITEVTPRRGRAMRDFVVPTPFESRVLGLADGTRTQAQIAGELGVSTASVAQAAMRLRARGKLVPFTHKSMGHVAVYIDRTDVTKGMPLPIREWFAERVTKSEITPLEFIRALITDAYHDDTEGQA